MDWLDIYTVAGVGACLTGIVLLLFLSRRWTGPAQAVRFEMLEHDVAAMKGNLARVDRDLLAWHRQSNEANTEILREIEGIRQMLAEKESLHLKVDEVGDRVSDLEQAVHALPCGQVTKRPDVCGPEVK